MKELSNARTHTHTHTHKSAHARASTLTCGGDTSAKYACGAPPPTLTYLYVFVTHKPVTTICSDLVGLDDVSSLSTRRSTPKHSRNADELTFTSVSDHSVGHNFLKNSSDDFVSRSCPCFYTFCCFPRSVCLRQLPNGVWWTNCDLASGVQAGNRAYGMEWSLVSR